MQLLNKFDNGIRFLFCVIDIFSKYAQVVTFKDKNGITITDAYQKFLDESGRKPNKMANHGQIEMIQKSIQCIMKKNLLLLKDLQGP